jgi:hypothetical protein
MLEFLQETVTDGSIAQGDPPLIEMDKSKAALITFGPGNAGIKKQYTIDLTEFPALLGMIKSPKNVDWSIVVKGVSGMNDIGSQYIILKSGDKGSLLATEEGTEFAIDVAEKTGWSGKCTFELIFSMSSEQKQSVNLHRLMKAASVNDHYSFTDINSVNDITSYKNNFLLVIILGLAMVVLVTLVGVIRRKRKTIQ